MLCISTTRRHRTVRILVASLAVAATLWSPVLCADQNWPSFRGASAAGVAVGYPTATEWDMESNRNIRWKTPIPGLAHSSPVIWGDRIFITTSVKSDGESRLKIGLYGNTESEKEDTVFDWRLYCLDRNNGDVLWTRNCHSGRPKVKRHPKSSHANATPCTDGRVVVAFFGAEGLYCYDFEGNPIWQKDLGVLDWGYFYRPSAQWGGGSSPIIHKDMIILQCDVQKDSFIAAYSLKDGSQLWKTSRSDVPTWGTPTVYTRDERSQIIVNGFKHIGGYDIETGAEIWKMTGGGDIPVPTPVVADDLVYITNAHGRMAPIYAVKLSARGDISLRDDESSNQYVAWSYRRGGNYMTTPIVLENYLYCCSNSGRLSCFNAATGELMYRENLGSRSVAFSASPVAADGKIYLPSEKGDIYVVKAGPEFEVIAVNKMNETCMATPAISRGVLFFRTRNHLVSVGNK
ncbi:MAG: PQQ-binding-like beta-propeller repeat protein [Phycisphaerales bacterium]|nr:MAG: PQQ-binding-like beta-propeller repeat protein [Phycisphaerales bacterium]